MPRFRYEARDVTGGAIAGEIDATNRGHALVLLRERGLAVDALVDSARAARSRSASWGQGPLYPLWPMRPSSVALFFDQLGRLLSAGVTPHEAFTALQDRVGGRLRRVAREGAETFSRGGSVSSHLERYPRFFAPHLVAIFRAGERSGQYADACKEIVAQCEAETKVQRHMLLVKLYIYIHVAAAVIVAPLPWSMAKALPTEMQAVPSGGSPYSVGVGAADVWDRLRPGLAVHAHLLVHEVLPLALAAFALWKLALLIIYLPPLTHMRDAVALYTPGISVGTRRAAAGRFSHVLQLMLRAAVPLGDAVAEAARATGNSILQRAVLAKAPALERGVPLREVLRDSGVFRPSEVSLIATAEETGTLEGAAADLAARARQDREDYISKAKYGGCAWGCLTSALLVLVAALIGYIGILHMYEQFYQWLMSP